jgi:hypothetical protein
MSRESQYQTDLIKKIKRILRGAVVLKNDEQYMQGIPDLLILWRDHWAMLEVKASAESRYRPNQEYWLDELNAMSFAAAIYPENEDEVLYALQQAFGVSRAARVPFRQ